MAISAAVIGILSSIPLPNGSAERLPCAGRNVYVAMIEVRIWCHRIKIIGLEVGSSESPSFYGLGRVLEVLHITWDTCGFSLFSDRIPMLQLFWDGWRLGPMAWANGLH